MYTHVKEKYKQIEARMRRIYGAALTFFAITFNKFIVAFVF